MSQPPEARKEGAEGDRVKGEKRGGGERYRVGGGSVVWYGRRRHKRGGRGGHGEMRWKVVNPNVVGSGQS